MKPRSTAGIVRSLLTLITLLGWTERGAAHEQYATAIQHRMQVTVGSRNIDVVVDLTFFEVWSERERRVMDANADGRITTDELDAYSKRIAPELARRMKLKAGLQELALVPLYDPDIDLLGNERVVPEHHRMRLYFFAHTPAGLQVGDEIVIEDRLWPDAGQLATVAVDGRDGCRLEAGLPEERDHDGADPTQVFRVRCLKPPALVSSGSDAS